MAIVGTKHVGLKLVSVALATLLWLVVTGDGDPKVVPVLPAIEGQPAPGFRLGAVSADPPTVEILGPSSQLDLVTAVVTEVLSIDGADAPFTAVVDVFTENADVRLSAPVRARVTVDVVPGE
jgi:YbbR domain-containing protein